MCQCINHHVEQSATNWHISTLTHWQIIQNHSATEHFLYQNYIILKKIKYAYFFPYYYPKHPLLPDKCSIKF